MGGGFSDSRPGGSGWRLHTQLENLEYGNVTVFHGGGDVGSVVLHRAGPATKKQMLIPVAALIAGSFLGFTRWSSAGLVLGYFGAQSGLSLYMKLVLSDATVSAELGLKGVPAAFLITGAQQVVAFLAVTAFFLVSCVMAWRWEPKRLTSAREIGTVLCLSLAFAANIGLNNFSLTLVAISLNLVIRSCLPLVTLAMQAVIGIFQPGAFPKVRWSEFGLVAVGVACAGLVTLAELETSKDSTESQHVELGVLVCVVSICAGSLDLILGKVLGKHMGLSALDTTWYMSLPTALALLPAALLVHHPAEWEGFGQVTDREVLAKVFALSPLTLVLVLLSGVFSVSYNVLRYAMVQHLSASHTAFAGNFNKALTIMISLLLGLERVPDGVWSSVMLLSVAGSISAFMAYSVMTAYSPVDKLSGEGAPPAAAALSTSAPRSSRGKAAEFEA
uniref:Sugar phosphate transporter domain-containing protein n=1 Tax=Alexandrium catenella TaxID=2925 RepID=A0A7S1KWU3_ALECA